MRRGRTCGIWAGAGPQLITAATASVQRIRDFLSVAWPMVTETCAQPLESKTWLAAMQVVTRRCGGQPGRLAAMGWRRLPRWSAGPWRAGAASGPAARSAGGSSPR